MMAITSLSVLEGDDFFQKSNSNYPPSNFILFSMYLQVLTFFRDKGVLLLVLIIVSRLTYNRYGRSLRRFGGPSLASVSGFWRLVASRRYGNHISSIAQHQRYGKIVRLGPKTLSFSQPEAVRDIYGPGGLTQRSDFNLIPQQTVKGKPIQTLFATTDTRWHDDVRKRVSGAFSMTSMRQLEGYVDNAITTFLHQLQTRFANNSGPGGLVDLPIWLRYFTDDSVTAVSYGQSTGHMELGEDKDGILESVEVASRYIALVGYMPILDHIFWKNPILMWLNAHGYQSTKPSAGIIFASKAQQRRREIRKAKRRVEDDGEEPLTDKFLRAEEKDPDIVGPQEVLALGLAIVAAGSGTTSIALSALLYHILKNPSIYRKLQAEIDSHSPDGAFDSSKATLMSFVEAQALPYLSAVIKETFRVHPSTNFAAERIVPPQGHIICGEHVPGGTIVSVNPWVLHKNKDIFGLDSDIFRPERWLEGDIESVKRMEGTLLHFGTGKYTCLGKNIALMEIYKAVPALLARFEISLAYPEKDWRILPGVFVNMTDFEVRLSTRTRS